MQSFCLAILRGFLCKGMVVRSVHALKEQNDLTLVYLLDVISSTPASLLPACCRICLYACVKSVSCSACTPCSCALVVIDFLVRHGLVTPEEPGYMELVSKLRVGNPC